jgi:hypothetical protein
MMMRVYPKNKRVLLAVKFKLFFSHIFLNNGINQATIAYSYLYKPSPYDLKLSLTHFRTLENIFPQLRNPASQ